MAKQITENLTDSDLEVMKVLWRAGALSAKEVHSKLVQKTKWSYSTTRTVIERMVKKGLLKKSESHGLNIYTAKSSRVKTLGNLIRRFAENVLETEPGAVAAFFGEKASLSKPELAELSSLFNEEVRSSSKRHER